MDYSVGGAKAWVRRVTMARSLQGVSGYEWRADNEGGHAVRANRVNRSEIVSTCDKSALSFEL